MKLLIAAIGIGVTLQAPVAAAPAADQIAKDYGLGVSLGYCITAGCQVFRGYILTDSPTAGDPIIIHPEEGRFGMPVASEAVAVPYEDFGHSRGGDGGGSLPLAWANVKIAKNVGVTVVLGLKQAFGVRAGDPVIVTSDDRESGIIRSLAQEATRFATSPESLVDATGSLSSTPNAPLAGLLFAFFTVGKMPLRGDVTFSLLSQLLGNPSVPSGAADLIAAFMASHYPALPPDLKVLMVRRFAELGQQPDKELAVAALRALADVLSFDASARSSVPPMALAELERSYRTMVSEKRMPRNALLEGVFGAKRE